MNMDWAKKEATELLDMLKRSQANEKLQFKIAVAFLGRAKALGKVEAGARTAEILGLKPHTKTAA